MFVQPATLALAYITVNQCRDTITTTAKTAIAQLNFASPPGWNALCRYVGSPELVKLEILHAIRQYYLTRYVHWSKPTCSSPSVQDIDHMNEQNLQLIQDAIENQHAFLLLQRFLAHPENYLIRKINAHGHNIVFPPALTEDIQGDARHFDRLSTCRRELCEHAMVQDAVITFPPTTTSCLRYLNTQPGDFLQSFIALGKLLQLGYANIEATFVAPKDTRSDNLDSVFSGDLLKQYEFLQAAAQEKGVTLTFSVVINIQDVCGSFHIIQAYTDLATHLADTPHAQNMLADKGRLYLGYKTVSAVLTRAQTPVMHAHVSTPEQELIAHNIAALLKETTQAAQKSDMHVAFLGSHFQPFQCLFFLSFIAAVEDVKTVHLTLLEPVSTDEDAVHTPSDLGTFLSCMTHKKIHVSFTPSFQDFQTCGQGHDIITLLHVAEPVRKLATMATALKEHHGASTLLFWANGMQDGRLAWAEAWLWDPTHAKIHFIGDPSPHNRYVIHKEVMQS